MLAEMRARGLTMLCANPDIVVQRGGELVYCAGALAKAYEKIGGEVVYYGKPHRPIYDIVARRAATGAKQSRSPSATGCDTDIKRRQWRRASTRCSSPTASTARTSATFTRGAHRANFSRRRASMARAAMRTLVW